MLTYNKNCICTGNFSKMGEAKSLFYSHTDHQENKMK